MNLNHLLTLSALAETGSFVGAARRLRLPPSTVTGHIAALEASLGVTLVIRTTRAMRLTAVGARLAADAKMIAIAAAEAEAHVARARTAPEGSLRLSLPVAFAHDLIAPLIGRFLAENPGIAIDLRLSNQRADLISDGIDLAIRVGSPGGQTLHARRLTQAETGIFVSADLPVPRTLQDLARLPWLGFSSEEVLQIETPDGPAELRLQARLSANDPKMLARAVAAGAGAALLPVFLMAEAVASGHAQRVLPGHRTPWVDIHLVAQGPLADTPTARRLTDFLLASLPKHI
jgi:DNA-binding transcriptional LysR family regulator